MVLNFDLLEYYKFLNLFFLIIKDMEVYEEKLRKSLIQYLQLRIQNDSSFKVNAVF